jgi:L,D-peptidoglycan transpeptidase YkuD (ErfK/YbiS/YcfS/YnhG family)
MPETRSQGQIIRVTRRPGTPHGGLLTIGQLVLHCQLGAKGIAHLKREGDTATPAGRLGLLSLRFRADRMGRPPGGLGASAERITPEDGWCDDVSDARYNRPVPLPFAASHERLWRDDHLYDVIGVLGWNIWPRSLGRGSAIFLHLTRLDGGPTAGCIALSLHDMRLLLLRLKPGAIFRIA